MKEKLTILIMFLFTLIVLAIAWFLMQYIVEEYDLNGASGESTWSQLSSSPNFKINNPDLADS
ncbi:hypothetical protein [Virgibacillus kimchii]